MKLHEIMDKAKDINNIKSDRELARNIGIANPNIVLWRKGNSLPKDEHMIKLAELSGINQVLALAELEYLRSIDTPAENINKAKLEVIKLAMTDDKYKDIIYIMSNGFTQKREKTLFFSNIFISKTNPLMAQAYA